MKDNWKSLQRYAPWFFLLVGVDLLAALFLWIADIQAFYAVLTALALISVLMFAAVFLVVVRHERRKARAFERFINSPDEFEEEALLKLCSDAEKNEIRLLGQVLREKQEDVNQLLTRVSDYEEYVESWAHETKMPISLLTFLLDNRKDEIPESVSFKLDYIRNRMQEYTNQMLFYARLKGVRKDYLFEHLYVRDCLDDVLEDYRPLLEEKGMEVIVRLMDVTVCTDRRGLAFVLSQLVSNSIKYAGVECTGQECIEPKRIEPKCTGSEYAKSGRCPKLVVEMKEAEQRHVLSFKDNGIGVRSCDLPYIFERGFTGDSGDGRKKATGMGLYLAKGVADDLNISLSAKSEWGKGFEMEIGFPVVG
ncbi:sensor histidine kinase [Blautia schinkii]|nr:sensor histidine kinase [Blautia schinkii]